MWHLAIISVFVFVWFAMADRDKGWVGSLSIVGTLPAEFDAREQLGHHSILSEDLEKTVKTGKSCNHRLYALCTLSLIFSFAEPTRATRRRSLPARLLPWEGAHGEGSATPSR